MRRNSLLAAGMLSVLLATSACGAVTGSPNSSAQSSDSALAGIEASANDTSSAEVGASQRAAAERAVKAAEAKKAEAAAAAEKAAAAAAAEKAAAEKAKADAAAQAAPASPAPAALPANIAAAAVAPAPKAAAPAPAPVLPQATNEQIVTTTYTTAYTWYDNTPAGSAAISHPVLHQTAGGTGTFDDPITIAVGHSLATGEDVLDFPAGTKIYLPDVRRYFIVEDTCGDGDEPQGGPCHQGVNANGTNSTIWIDMWIGGQSMSASGANECASRVTNVNTAVFNPASNYVVAPGAGVIHDGKCDAGYGNALVKQ
ncbi:hypothetical protein [Pseudarthrobacter siccitolerans]|uniref:hypothetical protein n=1 Tax=Pseudarthrobacter siccitolerans TaxID=861266 RepID=UPI000AD7AFA8|nr:hypothetical protein [Pseudarthrobacter siccitolerans]